MQVWLGVGTAVGLFAGYKLANTRPQKTGLAGLHLKYWAVRRSLPYLPARLTHTIIIVHVHHAACSTSCANYAYGTAIYGFTSVEISCFYTRVEWVPCFRTIGVEQL